MHTKIRNFDLHVPHLPLYHLVSMQQQEKSFKIYSSGHMAFPLKHTTSSPDSLLWLIILYGLLVLLISPPVHYNLATLAFFLFLQHTNHVHSSGPRHIFPFACNTHIFTCLAPCHSDLFPRSFSQRKRSCHVMIMSVYSECLPLVFFLLLPIPLPLFFFKALKPLMKFSYLFIWLVTVYL